MLGKKPVCSKCDKEINAGDLIYVKMQYPRRKGMTEIIAFLKKEGIFICENCFNNREDHH
jgi:hypothetical protein